MPIPRGLYTGRMAGRSWKTEAVVLRSIRYGEADRILHLFTLDRGRVGGIAKGARKTTSRFGARLEPFSHVELVLHRGAASCTRSRASHLVRSHDASRVDGYRMAVGLDRPRGGARASSSRETRARAPSMRSRASSTSSTRPRERCPRGRRSIRSSSRSSSSCCGSPATCRISRAARRAGRRRRSSASRPRPAAGSAPRARRARSRSRPRASRRSAACSSARWPRRPGPGSPSAAARDALSVVESSYEYHGGFRLRTTAQRA